MIVAGIVSAGVNNTTIGAERFANALDTAFRVARVEGDQRYRNRPLTIECWAKLHGRNWNILVAQEPKSSPTHWEFYTYNQTGGLSLYMPGYNPAEIKSSVDVVDRQWHYLAAVVETNRVRLYVDGRLVKDQPVEISKQLQPKGGILTIGQLAEGRLGCQGAIGEVRISNTIRTIDGIPTKPLDDDEHTIGLWRLNVSKDQDTVTDLSRSKNDAKLHRIKPLEISPNERMDDGQVAVIAPKVDILLTRQRFEAVLDKLDLTTLGRADDYRDAVLLDWEERRWHLSNRISGRERLPGPPEQAFDRQAICTPEDRDPLGVILRRTRALIGRIESMSDAPDLSHFRRDLAAISQTTEKDFSRDDLYLAACAIARRVAFSNPLLDFDEILFIARGVTNGSRAHGLRGTNDRQGQHFHTQYYGFNAISGGGLYTVSDFKTNPKIRNIVADSTVLGGRLAGRKLESGAFLSPDLSYDGRSILFAWTEPQPLNTYVWTPETTWNLFRVGADGSQLTQLTDSQFDDFDPCFLPSGRIAFISERRGGYIRCFGGLEVPQHTLHSMAGDGRDIRPLSWFVTGEWHPSVNNDGMIVYTRWDYVDRENCLGSNFWICGPDGRNPRAPHGNYPYPWHTFEDNNEGDSRKGRPYTEMNIRAVPNSSLYISTAAPHHGEAFGSLVMLDLSVPDDARMSQVRRITPYVRFPESEQAARRQYPFGTAWPLSEDFYLVNWWENIYLLDRFGNQVLVCENSLVFDGKTNWQMRLIDPIPLRPRKVPPALPPGIKADMPEVTDLPAARISVMNVYNSEIPFPPGTEIKYLRVLQDIPKSNPQMNDPKAMGYHWENTPRIPLGIVPVEADGSAHFEAPVNRALMFQALDERFMAVQTMRSVTYVQRGEHLSCVGCHESPSQAPSMPKKMPIAMARQPSRLEPEVGPVEPITFYRLVEPVFQHSCIPCHQKENKGPQDMSFEALRPYVYYFAGGMRGSLMTPIHGGSRSIPGRVGARNSRMGRALLDENHQGKIADEDYRRVVLWLDANALMLGAFYDEEKQKAGELVWPKLDVDRDNPQGLE